MCWWSGYPVACDFLYNGFAGLASSGVSGVSALPTEASLKTNVSRTIMFTEDWKQHVNNGKTDRGSSGSYMRTFGFNMYHGSGVTTQTNVGSTYGAHGRAMTTGFMDVHVEGITAMEVNTEDKYLNVWDTGTIKSRSN